MSGEIDLSQHLIEEYLDRLFEVVFIAENEGGSWDGLPEHLAATYLHGESVESVRVLNWQTKDDVVVSRPIAGVATDKWKPELSADLERPLYKVRRVDLLGRLSGLVLASGFEATVYELRYELFPGAVRFRADDMVQQVPVIDRAVFGDDRYQVIGENILLPIEPEHILAMPEITVEGLLPRS